MYNALTGRNEKVGNWAGVTVDKKEAPIKKAYAGEKELIAVDLPGAYSMSPFTSEESITSGYVKNEHPDAIINIVDATSLSRSLFFTTQLLELGIPVVVALNKHDINTKKETNIDVAALSKKLGCRCRWLPAPGHGHVLPDCPAGGLRLHGSCHRGWAYIVKAGTVILVCNTVVQIKQTFNWSFQPTDVASESILAIGSPEI